MASGPDLLDYASMFRRRRRLFLIPFVLLFGMGAALAVLLPPVYESTATIRIEKQQIPEDLIETTVVVGFVHEHLEVLSQKVLSTPNLWDIAKRLDLYPEIRDPDAKHVVAAAIRRNSRRDILYVDLGPEEERRAASVAVAFTLTYMDRDPDTARDVANALADLYIAESQRVRAEQATRLAEFLRGRSERLAKRIAEYEQELAAFKERHVSSLPEFTSFNLSMLDRAQDDLDRLSETIGSLVQQRIALESQLSQLDPRANILAVDLRTLSPEQQVERLRLDYMRLASVYSPRHPDLARLKNDLQALVGQVPSAADVLRLVTTAEEQRTQLVAARERYSEQHPDVVRAQREYGELRQQITALGQSNVDSAGYADNPAYVAIRSRLQGVEAELAAELEKRELLQRRVDEFDARLMASPAVERDFAAMTRDYEHALREYREARDKALRAELAERIEQRKMGDHFTLASPAFRPDEPARPQRAGIAFLGFIFGAGTGMGFTVLAEYFDRTVRGARGVMALWGGPPIATIPMIRTRHERRRRLIRLSLGWTAAVVTATGLVLLGLGMHAGFPMPWAG
jgi:uncharacterized protein involved in exopolysaccharide biosynthesis